MSSTTYPNNNSQVELPIGSSGRSAKEVAVAAAGLAEQVIVRDFSKVQRISYKGRRDVVTDTDVAAEKAIMTLIRAEFPDHGLMAEESGTAAGQTDFQWVIDPLDGTFNYSQAIPVFCTSIALAYQGEVILGVIKDPL
ncbi:MAG: inositol monophosphatase family protein, partial [Dehalococcoidia bacterium]|nr:inositol monophosphatase family protein [Dehalococcoidia bacterium]